MPKLTDAERAKVFSPMASALRHVHNAIDRMIDARHAAEVLGCYNNHLLNASSKLHMTILDIDRAVNQIERDTN